MVGCCQLSKFTEASSSAFRWSSRILRHRVVQTFTETKLNGTQGNRWPYNDRSAKDTPCWHDVARTSAADVHIQTVFSALYF
jgi:hypothetical protein